MSDAYDVVVIGAGIVGAACAYEFTREGFRVAVVESGFCGGGATAAGMGHIVAMDDSPAQLALTRYSQRLWRELAGQLPASAEYEHCGTLWVAADEEEMAEVERKHALYRDYDIPAEVVGRDALVGLEPWLREGLAGGLLVPEDGVLYAPGAARFLLDQAGKGNLTTYSEKAVNIGEGRARLDSGAELRSQRIVNAAGEWADRLTPGIPVKKRKGHLAITDRYPDFVRHQIVELGYLKSAHSITGDSVAFNVQPRVTGQILIGSSRQYDVSDAAVDSQILSRMLRRAIEYIPGLAGKSVLRTWTGFRSATPDKLPLIGPWQEDPTVFLATGHEGLGITTSLATARLLSDCFAGRESDVPMQPYLPDRHSLEVHHG